MKFIIGLGVIALALAQWWGTTSISLPSGTILMFASTMASNCPPGTTAWTLGNGRMPLFTTTASADVGGMGGSDTITPAGINSVPTFTGSALASHTHTYTDVPNHTHVMSVNSGTTGALSGFTPDTSTSTSTTSGYSTATNTGGVVTGTTNGTSAGTPAGTVSAPTFSGTQFDNRSAYIKVLACKVN